MSDAAYVTIAEAARRLGLKKKNLKRHVERAQRRKGRSILHGSGARGSVYHVNLNDLQELCPEIFPVRYDRAADELRKFVSETRAQQEAQALSIGEIAEGAFCLYDELRDYMFQLHSDVRELRLRTQLLEGDNLRLRAELDELKKVSAEGALRSPQEPQKCAMDGRGMRPPLSSAQRIALTSAQES